ncbi:F-box domain-containing protein [Lophiostoma macrostomum CBS 122681]|uniref:F-box domain-containing protein n=1 Tax=Lophiostoma macrostomum CBS 122681 TaxID=1314788 RepID=A0A6A6TSX0_9PLEO|nr:F-box domain-containing protein [Lophiostoma macrostomum CBS 122681]
MAPGTLLDYNSPSESRPAKKIKLSPAANFTAEDGEEVAAAVPPHPLNVKPAGNAFTASENLKSHCGAFARLPDELLNHILESFDADALVRLGSTCKALYAFTRLDELWRTLFIESPPEDFEWRGTWRSTYLNTPPELISSISCANLFSDILYRPFQCAHMPLEPFTTNIPPQNRITRLPDLTYGEFASHWIDKPFILTDPVKSWPIYNAWTPSTLLTTYPDTKFRAEAVDWPLATYMAYMTHNTDESPLYLFDRSFVSKTGITVGASSAHSAPSTTPDPTSDLNSKAAYWPPPCFGFDLFSVLGAHRPDHRWLIMGPARSGSTFHKDPNATSAWNAVLTGSKYWLMFPSSASLPPPPGVILSEDHSEITTPLSIAEYLLTFHGLARATPGCKEGVCGEGEVLHVPSGWFHLVLNLQDGLALTQNFVPRGRLGDVLGFLRDQRDQVSGFAEQVAEKAFEVFVERLRGWDEGVLGEGLGEMERKGRKGRGRWEELTKGKGGEEEDGGGGGFSFGFGGDESDVEVP